MSAGKFIKKLKPYTIKKGFRYLKHYGLKEFTVRLKERMEPEDVDYSKWWEKHAATREELAKQAARRWERKITISVAVPVYKTVPAHLLAMLDSVRAQSYPYWELCIVNASPGDERVNAVLSEYTARDSRIKVRDLTENLGIGQNTNAALRFAKGEYVGLLDHDDLLAPDALYEVASAIERTGAEIIYTDEDKTDESGKEHTQPHFKPDHNPDLLRSNNYICHFLVVKKSLIEKCGGFREGFDGAQDHDFILRCTEQAKGICHIPRILYHWRNHASSTADNPVSKLYAYESGVRAVEESIKRSGLSGHVEKKKDFGFYKVIYDVQGEPLVSIIIPTKDQAGMLKKCLDSIFERSTYKNFEIILVENNSTEEETFKYYEELKKNGKIRILTWDKAFNYSAINNFAAREAKGEYLLFLNNDIEITTPDWIEGLLGNVQRPEVGCAGCKLIYPDGTIQHAGVIIGLGGIAGHAFLGMKNSYTGYLHRAATQMDVSAVTAACMMMSAELFRKLSGFEERLTVAFNDVDLCLRICREGLLCVYDPYVELIHHESKTRGAEDTEEKVRRFQGEIDFMRDRWRDILKNGDPNYNPNLTLAKWNYGIRP